VEKTENLEAQMFKKILLAVLATFFFAGAAEAATITITLGATDLYSLGGTLAPNLDLNHSGNVLTLAGDAHIVDAGWTVYNVTTSPSGGLYSDKYLYVTGAAGSSAAFSLNHPADTIGLTWGTIDTYNTLTLTDSLNNVFAITGTDILNNFVSLGLDQGISQLDVVIHDGVGSITTAVLTSSRNSFEAGNFSAVPLPPTFLLFASGLIALAGFAVYKKARSQI
jgi:hypothetical protein